MRWYRLNRLAPETKLPEIISDVESAFGWVTESRHDSSILQLCRLPRDSF